MAEPIDHAIEILKFSGQLVQSWITRYIAVNGALMSAVGVIVGWQRYEQHRSLVQFVVIAICLLAIVSTIMMAGVIYRQMAWHAAHTERVKALQDKSSPLISDGMVTVGIRLPTILFVMTGVLVVLWILLLAAAPMML